MTKIVGINNNGLGDTLLFTALCKYDKNFKIQIREKNKRFSCLFQNLAEVEIVEEITELPNLAGRTEHYATSILKKFFKNGDVLDNRPLVLFTDEESEDWVTDFLKDKRNPAIFSPVCSGGPNSYLSIPKETSHLILQELMQNNITPIISMYDYIDSDYENSFYCVKNLELKKFICLMRRVGLFFGCNSGDKHLAVSVGAQVQVFQPPSNYLFNEIEWTYLHPSIKYYGI
jgi:hypothetical protein